MKKKNDHWIFRNLVGALAFVLGITLISALALDIITRHNQVLKVPDFSDLTFDEAQELAEREGVRVYVGDSVFVRQMRRGGVYSQMPKAGSKVKRGRRIMLTTNNRAAKRVVMPSLVGFSLQQARSELQNKGLQVGDLIYVRDIATNCVLRQTRGNEDIQPGTMVYVGTKINLVLGLNSSDCKTFPPRVVGMSYVQAINAIHDASMNVGRVRFDRGVENYADSLRAVVYHQNPDPAGGPCTMGSGMNLKLRLEK